ncbi:MAG: hypothetical protein Q8P67_18935 [archaeon]|nr:hypothetical protein [archaeon]
MLQVDNQEQQTKKIKPDQPIPSMINQEIAEKKPTPGTKNIYRHSLHFLPFAFEDENFFFFFLSFELDDDGGDQSFADGGHNAVCWMVDL